MRARVAWLLFAVSVACAVAETAVLASYKPLLSDRTFSHGWPVVTVAALAGSFMGALIVSRYERHRIGWLLSVGYTGAAIGLTLEAYGAAVLSTDEWGSDWAGHRALWLSVMLGAPYAIALVSALFLLAPHGELASRRWRPVLVLCGVGLATFTAGILIVDPDLVDADLAPDVGTAAEVLLNVGVLLTILTLVVAAVSLVQRMRRARGDARLQLRWIAASATAFAAGLTFLLVGEIVLQRDPQPAWLVMPAYLAYASLPVSTGVAVLRYRLYDIDVIINRAALLAAGTAFAAAGYVALVVLAGRAVDPGDRGFWASLAATALVALAFQPLRARAVRLADRVAYGPRAVPYEALADFSRRLGDRPSPDSLLPAAAEAAARAVSARRGRAVLSVPGGAELSATWPPDPDGDWVGIPVPVTDRGETLGRIELLLPPGRELRPGDDRLLADLADQAALAFRNARLEATLAVRVDELRARTVDLAASRHRLIEARDAERRRLASVIRDEVLPDLGPLPVRLEEQAAAAPGPDAAVLDLLVASTTTALDRLREISRGVSSAQLSRGGLVAAVTADLSRSGHPHTLTVDPALRDRRLPAGAEAAAYFCCTEAVRRLGGPVSARLTVVGDLLRVEVDGAPPAPPAQPFADRVEAAGGSLTITETPGRVTLRAHIPARAAPGVPRPTRPSAGPARTPPS